ncbi:hypothetical protein LINGRAHAP2_LOCUS20777 [Linum grandiflorum]
MAPIIVHFFTLLIFLSVGAMPTNSERLEPEVAAGCWKEIYQVPNCVFSLIKPFIGKGSIDDLSVPCCKAFLSLTGDCKVEIFQNSTVTLLIETFCTTIVSSSDSPPLPMDVVNVANLGEEGEKTVAVPRSTVRLV